MRPIPLIFRYERVSAQPDGVPQRESRPLPFVAGDKRYYIREI